MWPFNDLNPWKNHIHRCEHARGEQEELILVIVSIGFKAYNSNNSKMLTLQLDCRQTHFQHWYHSIAGNAAPIGLTKAAVILMPAHFHREWNATTLNLWIFAFHSIQAKWKGSLPIASMQVSLQSGLLQSLFPCPTTVKESSPCSRDSILTGSCRSVEDQTCTTPSAPAAGRKCLSAEEQSGQLYL